MICTAKFEYVDVSKRVRARQMFGEVLNVEDIIAQRLEESVAMSNYSLPFSYIEGIKRLCYNIQCNPTLLSQYDAEHIFSLTDEQMAKDTVLQRIQDMEASRMQALEDMLREKYENVTKQSKSEGLMRCRACGSSDVSWEQKQTRGADEAMTIFCSCVKCKSRWKMS